MVNDCFPVVHAFLKNPSKLKAILGRYPKSSNNVNSGKNMAIGGNITEITHDAVLNIPWTKIPVNQSGAFIPCKYYHQFILYHSKKIR